MDLLHGDHHEEIDVLSPLEHWMQCVLAAAGIVLGLMVCMLGKRVLKVTIFLLGFSLGATATGFFTWRLTFNEEHTLIAGFCGGILVAVIAMCVLRVAKFVTAASCGFVAVFFFVRMGGVHRFAHNHVAWAVIGVVTLVGAVALYSVRKHAFIFASAYLGSMAAGMGAGFFGHVHLDVLELLNNPKQAQCMEWQCLALVGSWLLFGTFGVIVQYFTWSEEALAKELTTLKAQQRLQPVPTFTPPPRPPRRHQHRHHTHPHRQHHSLGRRRSSGGAPPVDADGDVAAEGDRHLHRPRTKRRGGTVQYRALEAENRRLHRMLRTLLRQPRGGRRSEPPQAAVVSPGGSEGPLLV